MIDTMSAGRHVQEQMPDVIHRGRSQVCHVLGGDYVIDRAAADRLFAAEAVLSGSDAAFDDAFVETLTDYIVWSDRPTGRVTAEKAAWLIARIAPAGAVERPLLFRLLLSVLEAADEAVPALAVLALGTVRRHLAGRIETADAGLIERILAAGGGSGGRAVTRAEADILFDIADATAEAPNDPAFDRLFVRAIAHHLLGESGVAPMPRRLAVHAGEPPCEDSLAGSLRAAVAAVRGDREILAADPATRQRLMLDTGAPVSLAPAASGWLVERIGRDGRVTDAERALADVFGRRRAAPAAA